MAEEWVDVEYTSLHRYIRNTPSDTEVHAEHQLRADRVTWPVEKNTLNHTKLGRMKELGGKQECVKRIGPALGWWENWSGGLIPTSGQLPESEEKHLRLRVKQLVCCSLNGMRIRQSLWQPCKPWTGTQVPRRYNSWELEFRDCGAIPGRGLLLTAGGACGGKCL